MPVFSLKFWKSNSQSLKYRAQLFLTWPTSQSTLRLCVYFFFLPRNLSVLLWQLFPFYGLELGPCVAVPLIISSTLWKKKSRGTSIHWAPTGCQVVNHMRWWHLIFKPTLQRKCHCPCLIFCFPKGKFFVLVTVKSQTMLGKYLVNTSTWPTERK